MNTYWRPVPACVLFLFFFAVSGCGSGSQSGTGGGSQPNPIPSLTSISPSSASAGGAGFTLTATGTSFIRSSTITWNGSSLTTTFVSSISLQAQVPASDLANAGTAQVAVQNPLPGGGTSSAVSFTINVPTNPAPTVSSISPASANAGDGALTMIVMGSQFISTSQVLWNGTSLSTTYKSSTSLQAQVPASNLANAGTAQITVENPSPGGGTSSGLTFNIRSPGAYLNVLGVAGNDAVWDSVNKVIYVAVPASASSNAETITAVDPAAGTVTGSQALSSEASVLAISDDSSYLYALIGGGNTVQRFMLPSMTPDIQFSLGTSSYGNANQGKDMRVAPGAARTLAVDYYSDWDTLVGIFDDAVARPNRAHGNTYLNSIAWKSDGSEIFAEDTASTGRAFTTISVSASGASVLQVYGGAFRDQGTHVHLDPGTGYLYSDLGYILNTQTGLPVGNLAQVHAPSARYGGSPLVAIEPSLKRIFSVAEVQAGTGLAFVVQAFDMEHLNLLGTLQIPNAVGVPKNFIRWGNSGLALITAQGFGSAGQLYLIDGTFVNANGTADTATGTAIQVVPSLSSVTPASATVGGSGVNLTVTGEGFNEQTTLNWNGSPLSTTLVSATEVQASLPGGALAAAALGSLTATNGVNQSSNGLSFAVNPAPASGTTLSVYDVGGNDLVWDANAARLYVSVPGIQGDLGNSIAIVEPVTGMVTSKGFMGSDPFRLSISSDGNYLYAGFNGNNSIEQLALPGFDVNQSWNLGADSFDGPFYALDLVAAPGAPHTTAVTTAAFDISPSGWGVQIYDDAVKRSTQLPDGRYTAVGLQWGSSDATLYAEDEGMPTAFLTLAVNASGVSLNSAVEDLIDPYSKLHYDTGTGLIYTDAGQVIDPLKGTTSGSYNASLSYGSVAVPDSSLNRVFILGQSAAQNGTSSYTLESFDQKGFQAVGTMTIPNVVGSPMALIRWGNNGLAFVTRVGQPWDFSGIGPGKLYVIRGTFVTQ